MPRHDGPRPAPAGAVGGQCKKVRVTPARYRGRGKTGVGGYRGPVQGNYVSPRNPSGTDPGEVGPSVRVQDRARPPLVRTVTGFSLDLCQTCRPLGHRCLLQGATHTPLPPLFSCNRRDVGVLLLLVRGRSPSDHLGPKATATRSLGCAGAKPLPWGRGTPQSFPVTENRWIPHDL